MDECDLAARITRMLKGGMSYEEMAVYPESDYLCPQISESGIPISDICRKMCGTEQIFCSCRIAKGKWDPVIMNTITPGFIEYYRIALSSDLR